MLPHRDYFGQTALQDIQLLNGEIVFSTAAIAKEFASRGNKAMQSVIYDPQIAPIYQSVIEILRDGLRDGWITKSDLLSSDDHVFELFKTKRYEYDAKYFRIFSDRYNAVVVGEDDAYDFKFIKLKSRYFDPKVRVSADEVKRVSEIDAEFKASLEEYIEIFQEAKRGINLKLVF